jgi:hypothetical protein
VERKENLIIQSIKVWHTDKCCYKTSIPNEWRISESEEMIIKGKDFTEKDKCGSCRNFCSRYKISFHKEKLQLCYWEEVISVIETTALSNLIL